MAEPPVETDALCKWLRSQTIDKALRAQLLVPGEIMRCVLEMAREYPFQVAPILNAIVDHVKAVTARVAARRRSSRRW